MIIQRTVDTYVGYYDFAVTGGAIGAYDLQIPVPLNFVAMEFCTICVTPFTSGGAATVAFNYIATDVSPNTVIVGYFKAATLFSAYGSTPNAVAVGIQPGGSGGTAPVKNSNSISVGMSIAVAAITAGKFQIMLRGTSFDF